MQLQKSSLDFSIDDKLERLHQAQVQPIERRRVTLEAIQQHLQRFAEQKKQSKWPTYTHLTTKEKHAMLVI